MTDSSPRNLSFLAVGFPLRQSDVHQKEIGLRTLWRSIFVAVCLQSFEATYFFSSLTHLLWSSFCFFAPYLPVISRQEQGMLSGLVLWSRFTRRGIHFCKVFLMLSLGTVLQHASRHETVEKGQLEGAIRVHESTVRGRSNDTTENLSTVHFTVFTLLSFCGLRLDSRRLKRYYTLLHIVHADPRSMLICASAVRITGWGNTHGACRGEGSSSREWEWRA